MSNGKAIVIPNKGNLGRMQSHKFSTAKYVNKTKLANENEVWVKVYGEANPSKTDENLLDVETNKQLLHVNDQKGKTAVENVPNLSLSGYGPPVEESDQQAEATEEGAETEKETPLPPELIDSYGGVIPTGSEKKQEEISSIEHESSATIETELPTAGSTAEDRLSSVATSVAGSEQEFMETKGTEAPIRVDEGTVEAVSESFTRSEESSTMSSSETKESTEYFEDKIGTDIQMSTSGAVQTESTVQIYGTVPDVAEAVGTERLLETDMQEVSTESTEFKPSESATEAYTSDEGMHMQTDSALPKDLGYGGDSGSIVETTSNGSPSSILSYSPEVQPTVTNDIEEITTEHADQESSRSTEMEDSQTEAVYPSEEMTTESAYQESVGDEVAHQASTEKTEVTVSQYDSEGTIETVAELFTSPTISSSTESISIAATDERYGTYSEPEGAATLDRTSDISKISSSSPVADGPERISGYETHSEPEGAATLDRTSDISKISSSSPVADGPERISGYETHSEPEGAATLDRTSDISKISSSSPVADGPERISGYETHSEPEGAATLDRTSDISKISSSSPVADGPERISGYETHSEPEGAATLDRTSDISKISSSSPVADGPERISGYETHSEPEGAATLDRTSDISTISSSSPVADGPERISGYETHSEPEDTATAGKIEVGLPGLNKESASGLLKSIEEATTVAGESVETGKKSEELKITGVETESGEPEGRTEFATTEISGSETTGLPEGSPISIKELPGYGSVVPESMEQTKYEKEVERTESQETSVTSTVGSYDTEKTVTEHEVASEESVTGIEKAETSKSVELSYGGTEMLEASMGVTESREMTTASDEVGAVETTELVKSDEEMEGLAGYGGVPESLKVTDETTSPLDTESLELRTETTALESGEKEPSVSVYFYQTTPQAKFTEGSGQKSETDTMKPDDAVTEVFDKATQASDEWPEKTDGLGTTSSEQLINYNGETSVTESEVAVTEEAGTTYAEETVTSGEVMRIEGESSGYGDSSVVTESFHKSNDQKGSGESGYGDVIVSTTGGPEIEKTESTFTDKPAELFGKVTETEPGTKPQLSLSGYDIVASSETAATIEQTSENVFIPNGSFGYGGREEESSSTSDTFSTSIPESGLKPVKLDEEISVLSSTTESSEVISQSSPVYKELGESTFATESTETGEKVDSTEPFSVTEFLKHSTTMAAEIADTEGYSAIGYPSGKTEIGEDSAKSAETEGGIMGMTETDEKLRGDEKIASTSPSITNELHSAEKETTEGATESIASYTVSDEKEETGPSITVTSFQTESDEISTVVQDFGYGDGGGAKNEEGTKVDHPQDYSKTSVKVEEPVATSEEIQSVYAGATEYSQQILSTETSSTESEGTISSESPKTDSIKFETSSQYPDEIATLQQILPETSIGYSEESFDSSKESLELTTSTLSSSETDSEHITESTLMLTVKSAETSKPYGVSEEAPKIIARTKIVKTGPSIIAAHTTASELSRTEGAKEELGGYTFPESTTETSLEMVGESGTGTRGYEVGDEQSNVWTSTASDSIESTVAVEESSESMHFKENINVPAKIPMGPEDFGYGGQEGEELTASSTVLPDEMTESLLHHEQENLVETSIAPESSSSASLEYESSSSESIVPAADGNDPSTGSVYQKTTPGESEITEAVGYDNAVVANSATEFASGANLTSAAEERSGRSMIAISKTNLQNSPLKSTGDSKKRKWEPFTINCELEVDEKGNLCKEWARAGLCDTHRPTMFLFCRRTCLCIGPPADLPI
uniref:ShKT domain-containing protein n=1 Tax=Setaria digitata TaxID=48799 RepID=A0A915PNC5_9BILA